MTTPDALPDRWRDRARELEPYSPAAATMARALAEELEAALRAAEDEILTLAQAAAASGYSRRRLRELVAEGTLPNAGRKGAPRIRRGDLPVRPGAAPASTPVSADYDLDGDAAELAASVR